MIKYFEKWKTYHLEPFSGHELFWDCDKNHGCRLTGVLVVKNPVTNVDDTGSIPSLGRFCMSPEQLNPHTATTECKCCT